MKPSDDPGRSLHPVMDWIADYLTPMLVALLLLAVALAITWLAEYAVGP